MKLVYKKYELKEPVIGTVAYIMRNDMNGSEVVIAEGTSAVAITIKSLAEVFNEQEAATEAAKNAEAKSE